MADLDQIGGILDAHTALLTAISNNTDKLNSKSEKSDKGGGGASSGGESGGSMLAGLKSGVMAVVGACQSMITQVTRFVGAFNPAIVALLFQSFQDLQAAIGSFLGPIVEASRGFVNQLNAVFTAIAPIILPIVQQLGQLMASVGGVIASSLLPILEAFMPVIQSGLDGFKIVGDALKPILDVVVALLPAFTMMLTLYNIMNNVILMLVGAVLKPLGVVMSALFGWMTIFTGLIEIVNGLVGQLTDAFNDWIDSLMKSGVIADFTNMMKTATTWLRNFINGILAFLGLPALRQQARGTGTTQAAGQAQFIDTLEIGRQARLAAAGAGRSPAEAAEATINLLGGLMGAINGLGTTFTTGVTRICNQLISIANSIIQGSFNTLQQLPGGSLLREEFRPPRIPNV